MKKILLVEDDPNLRLTTAGLPAAKRANLMLFYVRMAKKAYGHLPNKPTTC
jgi:hypothetical protein